MATNFTNKNISFIDIGNVKYNLKSVSFHATEAEWETNSNYIPKSGEIVIYDKDSAHDYIRFKVGDGSTFVVNLEFANIFKVDNNGILHM